MTRRGLVLGCGGTVGSAWQVGALAALEDGWGWDSRTADVIVGTSGGASLAAMLGAGVGTAELVAAHRGRWGARQSVRRFCTRPPAALPALPGVWPLTAPTLSRQLGLTALAGLAPRGRTDPAFLDALIDDLLPDGGWVPHPAVWAVALDTGTGERVAFGSPGAPTASLRDAVRASWAIPGWFPPVTIGGRTYLDGGAASTASADLLFGQDLDEVVVIAPMAGAHIGGIGGRLESLMRRPMTRGLDREIAALESAGTRVVRLCPTAGELTAMGPNFMNPQRRVPALDAAIAGAAR